MVGWRKADQSQEDSPGKMPAWDLETFSGLFGRGILRPQAPGLEGRAEPPVRLHLDPTECSSNTEGESRRRSVWGSLKQCPGQDA